ncbi:thymocyte nuclear protein 1 isoform X2 [Bombina bombina]|uniref:thymocyte nuclear protein 1 isoform X2 n=1 Tax=Bombina bombina TaxID=8345 RepID=UPI00235A5CDB|nr:thymocyte nuclear protein 1 isoform X2 [Bombina bombina]
MARIKRKRENSPPKKSKEPASLVGPEEEQSQGKSDSKRVKKKAVKPSEQTQQEYAHWLMKSEPESRIEKGVEMKFGIEDLKGQPDQRACWDGVRNYQARNFMKSMKIGQEAFFYHSNCKEPGIAGIVKIVKEAYVDHTQFDKTNPHYDASSSKEKPRWFMVDVQFVRMMKRYIPLSELKQLHQKHKGSGGALKNIGLFTRARLSVQPLTQEEFDYILSLEDQKNS